MLINHYCKCQWSEAWVHWKQFCPGPNLQRSVLAKKLSSLQKLVDNRCISLFLSFVGESFVVGFDLEISVEIKPRTLSGVILSVYSERGDYLVLQLEEGKVRYCRDTLKWKCFDEILHRNVILRILLSLPAKEVIKLTKGVICEFNMISVTKPLPLPCCLQLC